MGQTIQERQLKVIERCRIETAKRQRETIARFSDEPLASVGLISYRVKGLVSYRASGGAFGGYSYIMIDAVSDAAAMREAFRNSPSAHNLEVWNGTEYIPVREVAQ